VLSISNEAARPTEERRHGYTLKWDRPIASPLGMDVSLGLTRELRRAPNFDIVHAHSHIYYATNIATMLRSITDTPLAVTCHGLHSQSIPHWLSRLHLRTIGWITYDQADIVFCYTPAERSELRRIGVQSDVEVVSNGIDVAQFSPSGEEYGRIAEASGPSILYVGRLTPGKSPKDALDVLDRLRLSCPDVTLFICGDGPLRDDLEANVEQRDLQKNVEFLGRLSYDVMPSVYRAADVFLLPSLAEGFPRTILEALACKIPVVATSLDQTESLLERTGYAVPHGNVEAFSSALEVLLTDPARRRKLGRRGREIVEEEYSWRTTVKKTTERLGRLAEDG